MDNKTISYEGVIVELRKDTLIITNKREKIIGKNIPYSMLSVQIIEQKNYIKFILQEGLFWRIARFNVFDIRTEKGVPLWDRYTDHLMMTQ